MSDYAVVISSCDFKKPACYRVPNTAPIHAIALAGAPLHKDWYQAIRGGVCKTRHLLVEMKLSGLA